MRLAVWDPRWRRHPRVITASALVLGISRPRCRLWRLRRARALPSGRDCRRDPADGRSTRRGNSPGDRLAGGCRVTGKAHGSAAGADAGSALGEQDSASGRGETGSDPRRRPHRPRPPLAQDCLGASVFGVWLLVAVEFRLWGVGGPGVSAYIAQVDRLLGAGQGLFPQGGPGVGVLNAGGGGVPAAPPGASGVSVGSGGAAQDYRGSWALGDRPR